jgi:peptidoglycan-N-acetylglucosamine deacetylase
LCGVSGINILKEKRNKSMKTTSPSVSKIALTVDIEDWYHLPPITGAPTSKYKDVPGFFKSWNAPFDYLSIPTNKTLNLLQELDIKATFFVVADVVQHYPGLVEKIVAEGHEIACHGLHHACKIDPATKKPLMTKTEFKERTLEAKEILEKISNKKIAGYRAPNAYVAGWMIDVLEEIGFKYDSSVSANSLYNKTDSKLKKVDTRMYYPELGSLEPGNNSRGIIEIPWPHLQIMGRLPAGGGPLVRLLGAEYIIAGLKNSLKRGPTTFYFHPIDMTEDNFPLSPSLINKLFWLIRGSRVEKRIRKILKTMPNIVTCSQLIDNQVYDR